VAINSAGFMVHNWDYQKFKELVPQFKQSSQKIEKKNSNNQFCNYPFFTGSFLKTASSLGV
jgi:hypothetical protein